MAKQMFYLGCNWQWHRLASSTLFILTLNLATLNGRGSRTLHDQVSWTPIYVDTSNRLDLWTISSTGCECPGARGNHNCACCVKPGGCLCSFNPNKCAQCGLEDACQRFCNVTISSRQVATKSGLSWAQIKSPELEGPTSCWWRLLSAPGQRIEVQIHRLVGVGQYDNDTLTCSGGFVQFADGEVFTSTTQAVQLCAQNSRYSPPVVLFGDQGTSTLLVRTDIRANRATLLAYVSFSSADDPIVGDPSRGGRLRPHSVCDWEYDNCFKNECVLVSPGYPGLFPPHRRCRFILNGNSTTDKIRIHFNWLSLPPLPLCATHHVAIWRRNVSNLSNLGNPWKTLCQESEISLEINGPAALIEFRSGSPISPYIYTGFRATVQFIPTQLSQHQSSSSSLSFQNNDGSSNTPANHYGTSAAAAPPAASGGGGSGSSHRPNHQQQPRQKHRSNGESRNRERPFGERRTHPQRQQPPPIYKRPPPSYISHEDEEDEEEESEEDDNSYPRSHVGYDSSGIFQVSCGHIFEGSLTRGNVFRMTIPRDLTHSSNPRLLLKGFGGGREVGGSFGGGPKLPIMPPGPFKCQLEFKGQSTDVVQLAVFNYRLRGSSCSSALEVWDVGDDDLLTNSTTDRLLGKLCGPSGNEVKRFTSSHSRLTLVTLLLPYELPSTTEYLYGAFRFHDESVEGTVKPMSSCEVVYYGVTMSPSRGSVSGPPDSPLLRLSTFPLVCAYSFLPGPNQSVALTLTRAGHETSSIALPGSRTYCRSFCGPSGCQCEAKYTPLQEIDHLLILSQSTPISCLCGYFPDALPMTFESQTPLTLVYHATQVGREFSYSSSFIFNHKRLCSNFSIRVPPNGSKRWREVLTASSSTFSSAVGRDIQQYYTHYQCIWPVSIPPRYHLTIDFVSEEHENDCRAWNLTLWGGTTQPTTANLGYIVATFCPREGRKEIKIPENTQDAYIRLSGVSLRAPQFEIRWKYTDVLLPGLSEQSNSSDGTPSISIMDGNFLNVPRVMFISFLSFFSFLLLS